MLTASVGHAQSTLQKPSITPVQSALVRTKTCRVATAQSIQYSSQYAYYRVMAYAYSSPSSARPPVKNVELDFDGGTANVTESVTFLEEGELPGIIAALGQIVATHSEAYKPTELKVGGQSFESKETLGFITKGGMTVKYDLGESHVIIQTKPDAKYGLSKSETVKLMENLKTAKAVLEKL
ncbi:MAG: hypothetical protein EOP84_28180 [Verrucomicrobiaceae bacterium]|nr:MAG: hypothetical protein EOP84_28180 [Verrucomicrobiaceae bacterium]